MNRIELLSNALEYMENHLEEEITTPDIALQYGYGSNEAFTRAFHQIWNCSPSQFRKTHQPMDLRSGIPKTDFLKSCEEILCFFTAPFLPGLNR